METNAENQLSVTGADPYDDKIVSNLEFIPVINIPFINIQPFKMTHILLELSAVKLNMFILKLLNWNVRGGGIHVSV